jgi:hypothetical protein
MYNTPEQTADVAANLLHGGFKDFFASKRGCFANTIRAFPKVVEAFEVLDETWARALDDWGVGITSNQVLPLSLFFEAHVRIRLGFELGFSRCLPEAWAVMRSGIESLAYGCAFLHIPFTYETNVVTDEELVRARRRLKTAFKKIRDQSLFLPEYGLSRLRRYWALYSGFGSHSSWTSLTTRLSRTESPGRLDVSFNFLETDKRTCHVSLVDLLICSCIMEDAMFKNLRARLDLDPRFLDMHAKLKDKLRKANRELLKLYASKD